MGDSWYQQDGVAIRYHLHGSGPRLALIHGVGASLEAWDDVADRLESSFSILRFDLRGLGQSTKVGGRYELEHFVSDFVGLLDHVGWSQCHVAGHSLGGLIAQGIAIGHGQRVSRLALISTVAGRTKEERERVKVRLRTVANGIAGDHFQKSVDRWFTPAFQQANPELIADLEVRNKSNDPECYAAAYRVLAETDLADQLTTIGAPTLVMTGEHDQGSNTRMAKLMHELIAGSELQILDGLRHSILVEAPDRVATELRDFFLTN